jgi:L-fuconolactonase
MIIDSHCHAWEYWPYQPPVPDPESRGRMEQLVHEMDVNGVDQALLVCAAIDHNPDNNAYVAGEIPKYAGRIHQIADIDCSWSETYHAPGAADRMRQLVERFPIRGFTHYLKHDDDGAWLYSEEGLAFFGVAAEHNLIASISCQPHHQAGIRRVAAAYPSMPILIHHLGHPRVNNPENLNAVLASAKQENIYIKVSGFYYSTGGESWDFPYRDTIELVRAEYEHFGPQRLCWGSDYPVVRRAMTYRQAIECFRTYCDFIPEEEQGWILGGTVGKIMSNE